MFLTPGQGWWKDSHFDYPKFGFLKISGPNGTLHVNICFLLPCKGFDCTIGDFGCPAGKKDTVDAIEGGGKGALAAAALALVLFIVSAVLGVARLFERFGGHIGMGAAATGFMGAFFITASWAIMVGVWVNWWNENVRFPLSYAADNFSRRPLPTPSMVTMPLAWPSQVPSLAALQLAALPTVPNLSMIG